MWESPDFSGDSRISLCPAAIWQLYGLNTQLRSAYEQSVAQYRTHDIPIAEGYRKRQLQAAEAARQAAQQQANWEAQFAYQQQQDEWERQKWQAQWDYNQQADQRDAAYSMAATMLKNGILPDSTTLASAGISQADAAAYVQAVQQAALKSTKKTTKSSPSTVTGGGGTQDYSGLFNAAYASGTPESFIANNYKKYGFSKSTGLSGEYQDWAADSGKLDTYIRSVNQIASGGNPEALDGYVKSIWGGLSGREREKLQSVLSSYGL